MNSGSLDDDAHAGGARLGQRPAHGLRPDNILWKISDAKNRLLPPEKFGPFMKGDLMELVTPSGNVTFKLDELIGKDGNAADVAPGSGHVVKIPVPAKADTGMIDEFAMLVRYLPRAASPATT